MLKARIHFEIVLAKIGPPLVGIVFLLSAIGKAIDTRDTEEVFNYLLGSAGVNAHSATQALILIEIMVGSALLVNIKRRWIHSITSALLVIFTLWAIVLITTGIGVGCGCGFRIPGISPTFEPVLAIIKNTFLLIALLFPALIQSMRQRPPTTHKLIGASS